MKFIISNEAKNVKVYFTSPEGKLLGVKNAEEEKKIEAFKNMGLFLADGKDVYKNFDVSSSLLTYYTVVKEELDKASLRKAVYRLAEVMRKDNLKEFKIMVPEFTELLSPLAEALLMCFYHYDEFLTKKHTEVENVVIDGENTKERADSLREGEIIGEAVLTARDLVNEPANSMTPLRLSEEIVELGKKWGFEVEVLKGEDLVRINAKALMEVGKSSVYEPCLIIMRYTGDKNSNKRIGLIGKGVTYDSGGLNLKSGARFITMKHDMAGSATMTGVMCALAGLKAKVNATALVAACENVIDGNAYKPGDIISSMAGKTIQITSTDAEGRLTMIDALYYAAKNENVDCLMDIATLTGAARRLLGDYGAPYLSTDDTMAAKLEEGAKDAGELFVRVPFIEEAKKMLECDVADYVNSARSEVCGFVTAGLFLRDFTDGLPYLHIDAAGPLWLERSFDGFIKGGSGWGVRSIVNMLTK